MNSIFFCAVEQDDFGFDARRIDGRAFHFRHRAKRRLDHGDQPAAAGAVGLEFRFGQGRLVLEGRVARLVGARHIDVLVESVGAGGVHEFAIQFFVQNAAHGARLGVERHAIIRAFQGVVEGRWLRREPGRLALWRVRRA